MRNFFYCVISALLCFTAGFMSHRYFYPYGVKYEERILTRVVRDTVINTVTVPNMIVFRDIPREIDTAAVIRDYFSSVEYRDTVLQTPSASLMLQETVEQNRIASREIRLINVSTLITRTPANSLWLGASVSSAPSLYCAWQHKDWAFGGGYAFRHNVPFISVSRKIKIW